MDTRRSPMTRTLRAALACVVLFGASGCGLGGNAPNPFDGNVRQASEDRLRIQVQNLNFNDVTVFAISSGQRVRLGNVTGKTDRDFRLRWNYSDPISFRIDVVGGDVCATQPILVEPGARVWVQIPNQVGATPCASGRA